MLGETMVGVGGVGATTVHMPGRLTTTLGDFGLGGGEE